MGFEQPLALYDFLVNTIAGSPEVFLFGFIIILAILGARFGMTNAVFLTMVALGIVFLAELTMPAGVYMLTIVIAGLIIGLAIYKLYRRE